MYRIIILRKWQENRVTYRFCIDNTPVKNKTKRSKLQNGERELVRWKCEYFLLYVNKKNPTSVVIFRLPTLRRLMEVALIIRVSSIHGTRSCSMLARIIQTLYSDSTWKPFQQSRDVISRLSTRWEQRLLTLWFMTGSSWPWSYGSWIYNYLCNQCLSPQMLWVRISMRARCTTLCDKVCQWLATCRWFPPPIKLTATIYLKYCWKWR
jgi:hypothetical protein